MAVSLHRDAAWCLAGLVTAVCLTGAGCPPDDDQADGLAARLTPVFILDTENLTPPAVGDQRILQPPAAVPVWPDDPDGLRATAFVVTLAAQSFDTLQMQLLDVGGQVVQSLRGVEPPAGAEVFSPTARAVLADGQGVFWGLDDVVTAGGAGRRFAVTIPESQLAAFTTLEVFSSLTDDGFPFGSDTILLTRGFFYMATIGDSVAWGNGLLDEDKYHTRVAEAIENELGLKVIEQVWAHSGARIVPDVEDGICGLECFREAPAVMTSATAQLDLIEEPELMDLVLINGCINDVGLDVILDPDVSVETITERTTEFCRDEMVELLTVVEAACPQALMVVSGYFPILSEASRSSEGLETWLGSLDPEFDESILEVADDLIAGSTAFFETAQPSLREAVDTINAAAGTTVAAFADPGYEADNALFAPDSWLWGFTSTSPGGDEDFGLQLFPQDPFFLRRADACVNDPTAELSIDCFYASVGHPNTEGAQAYAEAIIADLRTLGVLPPELPAE